MRRSLVFGALLLAAGMTASPLPADPARVPEFIRGLGSPNFAERQAAARALDEVGEPALPALRQAAKDGPDEETRRRAGQLVQAIEARVYAPLRQYQGHAAAVWSLAFSPDGTLLASASTDRTVKVWDVAGGHNRATLRGHESLVLAVAFSPDGKALASGGC